MNGVLSSALIGAAFRATAVACAGIVAGLVLRRRSPAAAALSIMASLWAMAAATALSFAPWPVWWSLPAKPALGVAAAAPSVSLGESAESAPIDPRALFANDPAVATNADRPGPPAAPAVEAPVPKEKAAAALPSWMSLRAAFAWFALAAVLFGGLRLALGLESVRRCLAKSPPIADPRLIDAIAILAAEMSCRKPIAPRLAHDLSAPATVGWRRPVILLPPDWTDWSEAELRAILAHEIAHIVRNDYLSGLIAQLSLALHFYLPPAHWLCRVLRFDQELAADAWSARIGGDKSSYLQILARLALRADSRRSSRPALAFLPGKGAFLRRIQMLRDSRFTSHAMPSRGLRAAIVTLAAVLAIGVAGLRGPAAGSLAASAEPAAQAGPKSFDLSLIPADAVVLAGIRPAEITGKPGAAALTQVLDSFNYLPKKLDFSVAEIEQVLSYKLQGAVASRPAINMLADGGFVIRSVRPRDWLAFMKSQLPGNQATEAANYEGTVYQRLPGGDAGAFYMPDDRTLVIDREANLKRVIDSAKRPNAPAAWRDAWREVNASPIALYIDMGWFRDSYKDAFADANRNPVAAGIAPLWNLPRTVVAGLDCGAKTELTMVIDCDVAVNAAKVGKTIEAAVILAKNSLDEAGGQVAKMPSDKARLVGLLFDTAASGLDHTTITTDRTRVVARSTADQSIERIVPVLAEQLRSSRLAAQRTVAVNGLKQIGLAFHNYQSVNNHFPPAVVIGPDGKTPHSWRIELLPFLEQQELFNAYKMDEPWDGPNNIKLVDKMPAVFMAVGSDGAPFGRGNKCGVFVVAGKGTLFDGPKGKSIFEITDGTSNTILAVSMAKDIPWTKPEDIPFDAAVEGQPLPKFGGLDPRGFNVLIADGSVRFLPNSIDPKVLRVLFTYNGGEIIDYSKF